jgi:hypothetical protein
LNWFNKINLVLQQSGKSIAAKLPGSLSSEERVVLDGNSTQAFIHVRLFAGKIEEALKFLERWCFGKSWFDGHSKTMQTEGKEALNRINIHLEDIKSGRKSNFLRLVRDKFGFHYDEKAVKDSMRIPDEFDGFITYLNEKVGNTLYLGSEYAVTGYLIEVAKQGDAKNTIEMLMHDTMDLARDINILLGHTLSQLYSEYFGNSLDAIGRTEDICIQTGSIEEIRLPFFTTPPGK